MALIELKKLKISKIWAYLEFLLIFNSKLSLV
jgi:hypothetical protein